MLKVAPIIVKIIALESLQMVKTKMQR